MNADLNGDIFKPHACETVDVDSALLAEIIEDLYFPKCRYRFEVLGVELHLLKSPDLEKPYAKFQGKGGNKVEKLKYDATLQRVFINADQYFEGIEEPVWEYMVGGYQALEKWLKERKGRTLSHEEIRLYLRSAASLKKTIEIQKELDKLYPSIEEGLIEV